MFEITTPGMLYYALAPIIALFIIYLVRPKLRQKTIPSIMFILGKRKKGKFNSFLRKLFREPLLLLQLLIIALISFTLLGPMYSYYYDVSEENTVIVLDNSASMTINHNKALNIAQDEAKGQVSLVLAKNEPKIVFENIDPKAARENLKNIDKGYTSTNIIGGIKMARSLLANNTGSIVVISDFLSNEEVMSYKELIDSENQFVKFIPLETPDENVGFVGMDFGQDSVRVKIKNYGESKEVTIGDQSATIDRDSIETMKIDINKGKTQLTLRPMDDFPLDNELYLYVPQEKNIEVLLLTNDDTHVKTFLESSPYVNLDIVNPPNIPNINHDVVVVDHVKERYFIKKISDDIKSYVRSGGGLIVTEQENIERLDLNEIMPVTFGGKKEEIEVTESYLFAKDLSFTKLIARNNTLTGSPIVSGKYPIVSYKDEGKGRTMYFGYEDNEFSLSASYPLFWNRALRFVSKFMDLENLNRDTDVYGEKPGISDVAVNLLNEEESDLTGDNSFETLSKSITNEDKEIKREMELFPYLIYLAVALLIFEIYYLKRRGDL